MTVRLYRSTDAGAPQLGSVGAIRSILKACLVAGYGSRTSAGWSMPFEDAANSKCVFKQGGTDGRYLWIDNSENLRYAKVNGYMTMSDIDTGTEALCDDFPDGFGYFSGTAYSTTTEWILIASDRFFYFIPSAQTKRFTHAVFFGDVEMLGEPSDYNLSIACYLSSSEASNTSFGTMAQPLIRAYSYSGRKIIRALSQQPASAVFDYFDLNSTSYIGDTNNLRYPEISIGGVVVKRMLIRDSVTLGLIGYLPSLLEPLNFFHSNSYSNTAYPLNTNSVVPYDGGYMVIHPGGVDGLDYCFVFKVDQVDG
jgi:hypothetical protein